MLKNFFLISLRFFLRQRVYSFINIVGLTAALVCALFILLWVRHEKQMDAFHTDIHRLYRMVANIDFDGQYATWETLPGPLPEDIRQQISGVEEVVSLRELGNNGNALCQFGDQNFYERGLYADPGFFKILTYPVLLGTIDPINDKSSVAISQRLARKIFGDSDPIGQSIKVSKRYDVQVKAVFADVPDVSSLKFDLVLPMEIYKEQRGEGFVYGNHDLKVLLKIPEGGSAKELERLINAMDDSRVLKVNANENVDRVNYYLQPLAEMWLHGKFENGVPTGGRILYVNIFMVVAIFIVVIACVNFMNMATAKASMRAKEVGVRKVAGAARKSLILQFIAESLLMSLFSMVLALGFIHLLMPLFNSLTSKVLFVPLSDPTFIMLLVILVLTTGLLAGIYPAFVLSGYKPSSILKGHTTEVLRGATLRSALVVLQFAITIILIASALVIYKQIDFIQNKNLGYSRESVVRFTARGNAYTQFETFRSKAKQIPGVEHISISDGNIINVLNQNNGVQWKGKPEDSQIYFRTVVCDYEFPKTIHLQLLDGRYFESPADTLTFIITRRSAEIMGFENPVGEEITQWGFKGIIVGVVEDVHARSMQEAIDPLVFMCYNNWGNDVYARIQPMNMKETLDQLEVLYHEFTPEYPFDYAFLDDQFDQFYRTETTTASLATTFTTLALFISGMGLLGLAAYTIERKQKEIAIRKTLGATVRELTTSMSAGFLKLVLIAGMIGLPVSYFLMEITLQNYAYRTEIDWTVFAVSLVLLVVFSVGIVISQVAKAALVSPAKVLKSE